MESEKEDYEVVINDVVINDVVVNDVVENKNSNVKDKCIQTDGPPCPPCCAQVRKMADPNFVKNVTKDAENFVNDIFSENTSSHDFEDNPTNTDPSSYDNSASEVTQKPLNNVAKLIVSVTNMMLKILFIVIGFSLIPIGIGLYILLRLGDDYKKFFKYENNPTLFEWLISDYPYSEKWKM